MLVHVIHLDDQCHPSLKSDTLLIGYNHWLADGAKNNREERQPYFHAVHMAPTEK